MYKIFEINSRSRIVYTTKDFEYSDVEVYTLEYRVKKKKWKEVSYMMAWNAYHDIPTQDGVPDRIPFTQEELVKFLTNKRINRINDKRPVWLKRRKNV